MSGFSPSWLDLREPVDARSRCASLIDDLRQNLAVHQTLKVVDLGAGTGANFRYLAPLLGGKQHWRLMDNDKQLIGRVPDKLREWCERNNLAMHHRDDGVLISGPDFECQVQCCWVDLAAPSVFADTQRVSLVTASALLDLVSEKWLRLLTTYCRRAGATVYFALTYDGRIQCRPGLENDALLRNLVNRHQLREKGFGPALGPQAVARAKRVFAGQGYRLKEAQSDWCLGSAEHRLSNELANGWLQAALEIAPDQRMVLEEWRAQRQALMLAPSADVTVGHRDLLGWLG